MHGNQCLQIIPAHEDLLINPFRGLHVIYVCAFAYDDYCLAHWSDFGICQYLEQPPTGREGGGSRSRARSKVKVKVVR